MILCLNLRLLRSSVRHFFLRSPSAALLFAPLVLCSIAPASATAQSPRSPVDDDHQELKLPTLHEPANSSALGSAALPIPLTGLGQMIDEGFLRTGVPGFLAAPVPPSAQEPDIAQDRAQQIALARARWQWGESAQLGAVVPLYDHLGNIYAYDVDFSLDGTPFEDYAHVALEWSDFCAAREIAMQVRLEHKGDQPPAPWDWASKRYGSVTVSATYDAPPIRGSRPGVSNFYAAGWIASEVASQVLDVDELELTRIIFAGTWERLYEFSDGQSSILVQGYEPWGWYDKASWTEATAEYWVERRRSAIAAVQGAGIDSGVALDSLRALNGRRVDKWLRGAMPPRSPVYIVGHDTYFTPYRWFGGCSPTSGSMVVNYYDEIDWYGKITLLYRRQNCPVTPTNLRCHVSDMQPAMRGCMNTNSQGGTSSGDIYPGMVECANDCGYCFSGGVNWSGSLLDWHWTDIVDEINGDHPFVFSCNFYPGASSGHSVACVGYDSAPDPEEVMCYNTWYSGGTPEGAPHSGQFWELSWGAAPHPGCGITYDVKLLSPDGYQTYAPGCGYAGTLTGGEQTGITWNNWGRPGHHVLLAYSTDGGGAWYTITSSTADDGYYSWTVPCVSTQEGRVLIQQYSSVTTLVSSDASYGDFEIVIPDPPATPSLSSPSNGSVCHPTTINFCWNSVSGAAGYELQVGTGCGSGPTYQTSNTCYQVSGLSQGQTYYWRVRAHNGCDEWGSWSGCWTARTAPPLPGTPVLSSPSNGSDCRPTTINLCWNSVSGAEGYELQVGTSCGSGPTYQTSGTCYQVSGLSQGQTYHWRVRARSECDDWGSWSGCWRVSTAPPPPQAPSLSSPSNGSDCYPTTITFCWNWVSGAEGYELQVGTSCGSGPTYQTSSTCYEVSGLSQGNNYHWRVRARSECDDWGNWSGCWNVSTAPPPPQPPSLSSPSNGSGCHPTTITFCWNSASGAEGYDLQVGTSCGSGPTYQTSSTCYEVSGLSQNETYHWRVRARSECDDWGGWGGCWTANTAPPPLTTPYNCGGSTDLCDGVLLSWSWSGSDQTGFKVKREGSLVHTGTEPSERSWLDADCSPGSHNYEIYGYNACEDGPPCYASGTRLEELLVLLSPNGGDSWLEGNTHSITWTSNYCISDVKLELSRSGPSGPWASLFDSTPNDGTEGWTVTGPPSTECYIRISDAADGTPSDISDAPFTISAEGIVVLVPNGGEQWCLDATETIEWISQSFTGNVKIELSRTGPSGPWEVLEASTPNDGAQPWTVAGPTSAECYVRVSDAQDGDPADMSDAAFAIAEEFVSVVTPNGGEFWLVGSACSITWDSNDCISEVDIELSRSGLSGPWETLFSCTPNDGQQTWAVTGPVSEDCYVRVCDCEDETPCDASDASFSIGEESITVAVPNGGEVWCLGNSELIQWTTQNFAGSVKIELSRSGPSGPWDTLLSDTPNDGAEPWVVSGPPSSDCYVRISDTADGSPSDISDAAFAIAEQAVSVVSPNGGELWLVGGSYEITWDSNECIAEVSIELSREGAGGAWETLFGSTLNDGTQSWAVTGPGSALCRMRVCDAGDADPCDISDADFEIQEGGCDSLFLPRGWTMVSLSRVPADSSASALFPEMIVYGYNCESMQYELASTIERGRGYWVGNTCEDIGIWICGVPLVSWTRPLCQGWEMIGSVVSPVSFENPQDEPDGSIIPETLYWYDPSFFNYVLQDSILPGRGYWVATIQPCLLTVEVGQLLAEEGESSTETPGEVSQAAAAASWVVPLEVRSAGGRLSAAPSFGVSDSAGAAFDPGLDSPFPPAAAGESALNAVFLVEDALFPHLRQDIRESGPLQEWHLRVTSSEGFSISWPQDLLPAGTLLLVPGGDASPVDMRQTGSFVQPVGGIYDIAIQYVFDPEGYGSFSARPLRVALRDAYPNPAAEEVSIRFEIPQRARVSLRIYDASGRCIRTLVDRAVDPGTHRVEWDGMTEQGKEVTSGMYFCVLKMPGFSEARRIHWIR